MNAYVKKQTTGKVIPMSSKRMNKKTGAFAVVLAKVWCVYG